MATSGGFARRSRWTGSRLRNLAHAGWIRNARFSFARIRAWGLAGYLLWRETRGSKWGRRRGWPFLLPSGIARLGRSPLRNLWDARKSDERRAGRFPQMLRER